MARRDGNDWRSRRQESRAYRQMLRSRGYGRLKARRRTRRYFRKLDQQLQQRMQGGW